MTKRPALSSKLQGFGTTIFAEMSALALQTGAINLGQGFPDSDGPQEVSDAAVRAIRNGVNQYSPGAGHPDLMDAIAKHQSRFWNHNIDPSKGEVLVTAGATEAIAASLLALCEPGDEVVVFDPTYDSYAAGIALAGAIMRPVTLRPDSSGEYRFEDDDLRAAFGPKTRLLLLNTPHNPTGKVFDRAELKLIAQLCVDHDVLAITDEVYEHLVFDGEHLLLAQQTGMSERTLTISSGGKTFSFTGWKIGWLSGPAELVSAARTAKQFLTYVNGAPFQPAIAVGLALDDQYFNDLRTTMANKRDLLCGSLIEAGFDVHQPQGTYFATADIRPLGYSNGVEFCLSLPETAGVVAIPSEVFYQPDMKRSDTGRSDAVQADNTTTAATAGDGLVRFCFAKSDDMLHEAGERLKAAFA